MKRIIFQIPIILLLCGGIIFTIQKISIKDTTFVSSTYGSYEEITTPIIVTEETSTVPETTTIPETTTSDTFTITLSFVGDCLLATNEGQSYAGCFRDMAEEKKPTYFLKKVNSYFLNDDFTIADCENVFSDSENLKVSDKGQYDDPDIEAYWFKSPSKCAEILSAGGIDCVSISNNHINDYGLQGHEDTRAALDAAGVKWGEEGKIVYYKKNGFKIAVVCASMYGDYAVSTLSDTVETISKKSDYQILYFHGGKEAIHEPEDWKINACHELVDAGFDLIMGDHPHVLQPMEEYNGATIIYSLGNFVFGGNRHPENRTIIYQHTLTITKKKLEAQAGSIIPCYVYTGDTNNWQPAVIKDNETKQKVLDFMNWNSDSPL